MKYSRYVVLLAVASFVSSCASKDNADARVPPNSQVEPVLPLLPAHRPIVSSPDPETLLYANVITESPGAAISKVAAAFRPEPGKKYDVEVRITAVVDDMALEAKR